MEDWSGFMDKIDEVVPMDQQPELLQKLTKGNFTLRIMYEQFAEHSKHGAPQPGTDANDLISCTLCSTTCFEGGYANLIEICLQ